MSRIDMTRVRDVDSLPSGGDGWWVRINVLDLEADDWEVFSVATADRAQGRPSYDWFAAALDDLVVDNERGSLEQLRDRVRPVEGLEHGAIWVTQADEGA